MRFIFGLLATLTASTAHAAIRPYFQDIKLPTQKVVERQQFTDVVAAASSAALSAHAGNTSTAAVTVTTFSNQPDVPRNVVITPGGTTNDVGNCTIVVNGTNYLNDAISENFAFAANASAATTGDKAFKTITSVVFPANCEDTPFGATWTVNYGTKIGFKRCMDMTGHVMHAVENGALATRPTLAADADEVEKNTAIFATAPNGTNDYELLFLQNYRCL